MAIGLIYSRAARIKPIKCPKTQWYQKNKKRKQCQQLSFKWSQSNVSAIDLLKLYSKLIQHRIAFVYVSVSVKCPQKPKFEKNWLAKDLTLGEKGLKFVIVRQKKTVFRAGFCEWWSWWRMIKKLRGCGNNCRWWHKHQISLLWCQSYQIGAFNPGIHKKSRKKLPSQVIISFICSSSIYGPCCLTFYQLLPAKISSKSWMGTIYNWESCLTLSTALVDKL